MNHIHLFEAFVNEADAKPFKFSWKQNAKGYGKPNIGYDNSKRSWTMSTNGDMVAWLHNSGYRATSLGGDMLNQWSVTYAGKPGVTNFTLNKKFEDDQLEAAKKWVEEFYTKVASSDDTAEDNIKKFKGMMKFPVKPVKGPKGPFGDVVKILRAKLGDKFKQYLGTDRTMLPLNYHWNFEETGILGIRHGDAEAMAKMLQDALGDAYKVEAFPGKREMKITLVGNEAH
jgi:hypothetical protein